MTTHAKERAGGKHAAEAAPPEASRRVMKHVALLVETSRSYGRDVLKGVNHYIAEHDHWSLFLELRALDSQVPRWLASWQGDGIIARTASAAMAEAIAATGLPGVELRASKIPHGLPFVGCDNRDIGRLVADHFIDNGFTTFAVFDLDTERYFEERRDNFRAHLASRGHTCHEHHAPNHAERPANWERHQADVAIGGGDVGEDLPGREPRLPRHALVDDREVEASRTEQVAAGEWAAG